MIPKTPYLIGERRLSGVPIKAADREFPIAWVELSTSVKEMEDTAFSIIKACNSHEALVSALREFADTPECDHAAIPIVQMEHTAIYCRWCRAGVVLKELDTAKTTV